MIHPKQTFATFVPGNCNNFAHAVAFLIAQEPGKIYNPIFLYGGPGLGKTHLLHAIAHHIKRRNKSACVTLLSAEQFTTEFITAVENNAISKFRKKHLRTDILILDDLQVLIGRKPLQEELFKVFLLLHAAKKQIVLACSGSVHETHKLVDRLVYSFEFGLATDLQVPDAQTRFAILREKAKAIHPPVPDDVLALLARQITTNVGHLEAALNRLAQHAAQTGKPPTLRYAAALLRREPPYDQ